MGPEVVMEAVTEMELVLIAAMVVLVVLAWATWRHLSGRRRCWTCQHFDYGSGQQQLRSDGPFWSAAQYLPPSVMSPQRGGYGPPGSKWTDFGACLKAKPAPDDDEEGERMTLTRGVDVCPDHKLVPPRVLLRRLREEEDAARSPM